ncbi:MAG: DUF4124 domain-containing protein [Succinivibrionaceae bacterium]|nr:DUF4124 domain-containing protein [Succinivibrionaceae bacterium]
MKKSLLLFLAATVALSGAASAEIHKWTDANGTVHYSDSAPEGVSGVTKVELQEPNVAKRSEMNIESRSSGDYHKKVTEPTLTVTSPEDGAVIRDNAGNVTISGSAGNTSHGTKVSLLLDGKEIASGNGGISKHVENLDRGTHVVTMQATLPGGQVYTSKPVTFTLQRYHK